MAQIQEFNEGLTEVFGASQSQNQSLAQDVAVSEDLHTSNAKVIPCLKSCNLFILKKSALSNLIADFRSAR